MTKLTQAQFAFLAAVNKRGLERVAGQATVEGHSWGTQAACEKRGLVKTRNGAMRFWERYYGTQAAVEQRMVREIKRYKAQVAREGGQ